MSDRDNCEDASLKTIADRFTPALQQTDQPFSGLTCMKKLLDSVSDLVLVIDENRRTVFANRTLINYVNAPSSEALNGLRVGEVFRCEQCKQGECGSGESCCACGVFETASGQSHTNHKYTLTCSTGEVMDFQIRCLHLTDNGKPLTGLIFKDISSENRRRVLERIFFHDIANTASGILALADLLEDKTPEQIDELRSISRHLAKELLEEVSNQQDLVSAESNELKTYPVFIHAQMIVEEVMDLFRHTDTHNFEVAGNLNGLVFISDKTLLRRVLMNMVRNAVEASVKTEPITIGCETYDKKIQFWVHNHGCIERDIERKIFKRFFSTKGKGRGLGTYSIKLLTERYLGGRASFATTREEGTIFRITLPLSLE